jgi:hypothetical protein
MHEATQASTGQNFERWRAADIVYRKGTYIEVKALDVR